jgi:hypothetical protein
MLCATLNANSLQRLNIMADRPLVPVNVLMTLIRRCSSIIRSSSRMSPVAVATDTGGMQVRAGSNSARQVGHVFFCLNDDSKHDVQNLCPHFVTEMFLAPVPGVSKQMAHTSAASAASAASSSASSGSEL